jgi:hypothetical protein
VTAARKPHDVGNGLVCGSFGPAGEWLSLGTVDSEVGFVELTGMPPFEPEWRGDAEAARRYRSWMRREKHAFLVVDAGHATVSARHDAPRGTRGLIQRLVLTAAPTDRPAGVSIRVGGRLARPAYAEITEVDPPTSVDPPTRLSAREGTLLVQGEGAPVIVQVWQRQGDADSTEDRADKRVQWKVMRRKQPVAVAWIEWPVDAAELQLDIGCTFDQPAPEPPGWLADVGPAVLHPEAAEHERDHPLEVPPRLQKALGRMNQRAAAYVRGCTALQVDGAERTILTDHRLLPLSWTRDAYWQARLLLATWARGGHGADVAIVADHLRWLFLRCERLDGRWVRSHYADGAAKDRPFQADQQLYPLLELTEYVRATNTLPELPPEHSWDRLVDEAWAAVEDVIDEETNLIATDENSADEEASLPHLLSDQVLLWRVATRMAELAPRVGSARGRFRDQATRSRRAVKEHFEVDGPVGPQWAYAVDGKGASELYVDANDLPVALAPLWGFCGSRDRRWRGTMRFAVDAANPGFVPGEWGGLGSRHTGGTWTLGDIGRWVAAGVMGDSDAADAALERLVQVAFSDGMLPEAYDPDGSGSVVRHWFAWPGAALGVILLEHSRQAR